MSRATRRNSRVGVLDVKADPHAISRLNRQSFSRSRAGAAKAAVEYSDATNLSVDWSNLSDPNIVANLTANQISANKLYYKSGGSGGAGVIIPFPFAVGESGRISTLINWKAGGSSDVVYLGPDTGVSGHTPAVNSPDASMIGMNSLHARGVFIGATLAAAGTFGGVTTLGASPTTDKVLQYEMVVEPSYCITTIREVGSDINLYYSYINRALLAAAGKSLNNFLIAVVDSRQTGGSSIEPVVLTKSRQLARTRTVASSLIQGREHYHHGGVNSLGDPFQLAMPKSWDPRKPVPLIVNFHQSITGYEWTPFSETRFTPLTKGFGDAGYAVLGINDGLDRYGNQASLDNYQAHIEEIIALYNIGPIFWLGESMGSLSMMNLLAKRKVISPAAIATIGGAFDLRYVYDLAPAYATALQTAFGIAVGGADYYAKTAGFDPIRREGWEFRGVPIRQYTSAGDTVQPSATQEIFSAMLRPFCAEATVVYGAGGHLDVSQYNLADMLAFFNKYL